LATETNSLVKFKEATSLALAFGSSSSSVASSIVKWNDISVAIDVA
jgi:hypothetical protein